MLEFLPILLSLIGFLIVGTVVQAGVLSWAVGRVANKPMHFGPALACVLVAWPLAQGMDYLVTTVLPMGAFVSFPARLLVWGGVISVFGQVRFGPAAMSALAMSVVNGIFAVILLLLLAAVMVSSGGA